MLEGTLINKAKELRNHLMKDFLINHIGIDGSKTDFGESCYLTFWRNDTLYKIRISDHEATNPYRVVTEIMFKEDDPLDRMIKTLEQILFPERFEFRPIKEGEKPTHIKNGKPCIMIKKHHR